MEADGARGRAELRALYGRVDAAVEARPGLRCRMSGRCCRFREAGHRLYLTRLEFEEMRARGGPLSSAGDGCPWFRGGLCVNREGRALACRTYHCSDEAAAAALTERFHGELRRLHERLGLSYEYRSLEDHLAREAWCAASG